MATAVAAVVTAIGGAGGGGALLGSILGGVISGIGAGMMKKKELKAEENSRIAEERRQEQRYSGVGQATRLWEQEAPTAGGGIDPDYQRVQAQDYGGRPVGQGVGFDTQLRSGEQYRDRTVAQRTRPTYDRATRSIQYS